MSCFVITLNYYGGRLVEVATGNAGTRREPSFPEANVCDLVLPRCGLYQPEVELLYNLQRATDGSMLLSRLHAAVIMCITHFMHL